MCARAYTHTHTHTHTHINRYVLIVGGEFLHCDTDHYLILVKDKESLAVVKQKKYS
jgi:hypothetical protein